METEKSKADKMFEELGYKKDSLQIYLVSIVYIKSSIRITFYNDKTISTTDFGRHYTINMQELQAINQKCKELGWL